MSVNMEVDDNMIVLVVEDERNTEENPIGIGNYSVKDEQEAQIPFPITFKIEPLEDAIKQDTESNTAKSEQENAEEDVEGGEAEYEVEYLEELPIQYEEEKFDYVQNENHNDSDDDYKFDDGQDDDSSDSEYKSNNKMTLRKRTPKRKTLYQKKWQRKRAKKQNSQNNTKVKITDKKYVSYVQQLREENPAMAKDEKMLINHLAVLMRETIPPDPPEYFCSKIDSNAKTPEFACGVCGYLTNTLPAAARHYQYKHGEFYLTCYACGIKYSNTPNLYKHEKRCRAPDAPIVLRARGQYLGRKGRGRPFTTTTKFVTRNTFVKREDGEGGEYEKRRLFCTKCPASFAHRENLTAHENAHEGLRPYRCRICPAAYTSKVQYKRHMNLHGDYQFICDHCGRKFKLKDQLVTHLQTHQPLRRHPCLYCERRFTQKSAFVHHMNTKHLNLPGVHGCPVCPKRYAKMSHVKEHMARKHGLTMITAKMFLRSMPMLSEEEVRRTSKLFNFDTNFSSSLKQNIVIDPNDSERILPDLQPQQSEPLEDTVTIIRKKRRGKIGKKKKKAKKNEAEEIYIEPEVTDIEPEEEDIKPEEKDTEQEEKDNNLVETDHEAESDYSVEFLEEFVETEEEPTSPSPKEEITESPAKKPRRKYKPYRPRRVKPTPIKIDEEIDVDMCNIEYKRKRKTATPAPDIPKTDEDMYRVVRDIKSTLINRKKEVNAQAEKKKSSLNFFELKCAFMNQLKNEIEIPESKDTKPGHIVPKTEPVVNVPGTEIPEDCAPWVKKTDVITKVECDDDDDDEEWKNYKDTSEKNKAVADFLEYVKTGVVPRQVTILRRRRENIKREGKKK